jgi:WD40 repeat protein
LLAAGDDFSGLTVWSWRATSEGGGLSSGTWSLVRQWRAVSTFNNASMLDFLRAVAWSKDSNYVAAGSSNGTVCVLPLLREGVGGPVVPRSKLYLWGHTAIVTALGWVERSGDEVLLAS